MPKFSTLILATPPSLPPGKKEFFIFLSTRLPWKIPGSQANITISLNDKFVFVNIGTAP
ncbi:MAG: hypothetical protein U0401_04500 [Anaerolineae bacterium]